MRWGSSSARVLKKNNRRLQHVAQSDWMTTLRPIRFSDEPIVKMCTGFSGIGYSCPLSSTTPLASSCLFFRIAAAAG